MILNLTQHPATAEQLEAGVVEPPAHLKSIIQDQLSFLDPPVPGEVGLRAERLADICQAERCERALIGGALWLMGPLERKLRGHGITPLYSFSRRESTEEVGEDGTVIKRSVFRHIKFIEGVA